MRKPASRITAVPKTKASRAARTLRGVVVVLDPGHGGTDPGASREGIYEAALSYRMAATLAEVLKPLGAEVRFTVRSAALRRKPISGKSEPALILPRDATLPNGQRLNAGREVPEYLHARAAVAARAWKQKRPHVVFLALHFDVSENPNDHGGFAMWDIRENHACTLACEITRRFAAAGLSGNRRPQPRPNDLGVLNPQFNPVRQKTLVELATITNTADRKKALDPKWRWRVARILAAAIVACKKARLT
ncbi:N-acetylmuramoyl-L-alanine amidase [Armatimonas sp.]|uniref:N-acetylmuramoyl-L-alanine amidase family protein n=1 Tax=Armatimonas sp. TaxID=1872638 RepID=UPI003751A2FF